MVFEDADLEAAVHGAVAASLINTGQDCTAATRAYVHVDRLPAFVAGVGDLYATVRLGAPADEVTDLGPLYSAGHRDKVAGMVAATRAGEATIRQGVAVPGGDLADGFWFPPTLVTGVDQPDTIVQQEVFGPVLTVVGFGDDGALRLANDSRTTWPRRPGPGICTAVCAAPPSCGPARWWINDHIPIWSQMPHLGIGHPGNGCGHVDVLAAAVQVQHVGSSTWGWTAPGRPEGLAPDGIRDGRALTHGHRSSRPL